MSSLKDLLKGSKTNSILEVTILKVLSDSSLIVGDKSSLAILLTHKDSSVASLLVVGCGIKLIKPEVIDTKTLKTSPRFKIQPGKPVSTKHSQNELEALEKIASKLVSPPPQASQLLTFKTIEALDDKSTLLKTPLTVLVVSISRSIQTQYGPYKILGIKDTDNITSDLNLYGSIGAMIEPFQVYCFTKIKITNYKPNDFHRLATTRFTVITKASAEASAAFADVTVAEKVICGSIAGLGDITEYISCTEHKKKVSDEGHCPVCGEDKLPKTAQDFYAIIYVIDTDSEVFSVKMFSKQLTNVKLESPIDAALQPLVDKKVKIDANTSGEILVCVRLNFV